MFSLLMVGSYTMILHYSIGSLLNKKASQLYIYMYLLLTLKKKRNFFGPTCTCTVIIIISTKI
jgi:hypothetical protein